MFLGHCACASSCGTNQEAHSNGAGNSEIFRKATHSERLPRTNNTLITKNRSPLGRKLLFAQSILRRQKGSRRSNPCKWPNLISINSSLRERYSTQGATARKCFGRPENVSYGEAPRCEGDPGFAAPSGRRPALNRPKQVWMRRMIPPQSGLRTIDLAGRIRTAFFAPPPGPWRDGSASLP
jgi:hypothetical protein